MDVDVRTYTAAQAEVARLYDLYRTARLSQKYYAHRLKNRKRWTLWMDIVTALATSSAFLALAFFQTDGGRALMTSLVGLAAVISALRPVLKLSEQIERSSRLHYGWGKIHYEIEALLFDVRRQDGLTEAHRSTIIDISERYKALSLEDDPGPSPGLRKRFQDEVRQEIPADRLWLPQS